MISILIIKFWLLLTSQMNSFKNHSLIYGHCVCMDWLSACVAIERAVNVSSGVNFNKVKSKQVAKWIICLVFIITGCTHIHDPIHRYLIDDEAEHRTWCIVQYSSSLQTFDWIVNILHFVFPFAINCNYISIGMYSHYISFSTIDYFVFIRMYETRSKSLVVSHWLFYFICSNNHDFYCICSTIRNV
jgi:tetrahydromethanopterin S-methyltransferase subunit C